MDLYEALKNGTTHDELVKTFYKNLDQAEARIEAETAQKKTNIAELRRDASQVLCDYFNALFDSDVLNLDVTNSIFEEAEKKTSSLKNLVNELEKSNEGWETIEDTPDLKIKTYTTTDEDIIKKFIEGLK